MKKMYRGRCEAGIDKRMPVALSFGQQPLWRVFIYYYGCFVRVALCAPANPQRDGLHTIGAYRLFSEQTLQPILQLLLQFALLLAERFLGL